MKKRLLLLLGILFIFAGSYAQQKSIVGKVTDEQGVPLPGVSVKVKGTNTGSSTGPDGEYSVRASSSDVLVFSFIGSLPVERSVGGETTINVTLRSDTKSLQEVVVVGYGTQKKATLTGAISTVDVEEVLASRPVTDVVRALQGAVPGLTITSPSGELGSNPRIRLRS
ncbi:MAG TPA: carboxypeptidase-like regulatory domain-containing protein, partial [Sphingobacteriaceae bacterium]